MEKEQPKERPLECTACRRPLKYKYTEVGQSIQQCYYMCSDCPILQQFKNNEPTQTGTSKLACGDCGTSLSNVQHGEPLGCSSCYKTFESFIVQELKKYVFKAQPEDSIQISHQGHRPNELKEVNPSLKILALNEALNQMLNEENYEQAAWLRDQIQELKRKIHKT